MADPDRGQSELIGFVLIFGIVIMAISLIGIAGFGSIDAVSDHQRTSSAEEAMTAMSENIAEVVLEGAPERSTEIGLTDAALGVGEPTTINVSIEGEGEVGSVSLEPIVYEADGNTQLAYEGSAVFRADDGHSLMLREPDMRIDEDRVVLPLVETTATGSERIAGTTTVNVETRRTGTEVAWSNRSIEGETVTIEVSSPHYEAWERYFDGRDGVTCDVDSEEQTVECTVDPEETLIVTVTTIEVTFR